MAPKQQALIYLRQSLDATGDEAAVTRQRRDARAMCRTRGWTVVAEHVDNDTSAAGKKKRPGFEAVLSDVEHGRATVVVAWDFTRLSRNARDTLRILEVGERYGVTLALVRGSDMDLSTPAGRLTANILGSVARHEIDQKADRQRAANRQLRANGEPSAGLRSYGYLDRHTLHPDEAPLLAGAYEQFNAGAGLAAVRRWLEERGAVTSTGRPWQLVTLRGVLRNPRNAAVYADENGHVTGHGKWPAVVPYAVWRAARDRLDRQTTGPVPRRYALSGVILCGRCGRAMYSQWRAGGVRVYRCEAKHGGCSLYRRAEPIDEWVFAVVEARLEREDLADLLAVEAGDRTAVLGAELVAMRERRKSLARLVRVGAIPDDEAEREGLELVRQIEAAEAELADLGRDGIATALASAPDPVAYWRATEDQPRRRAAIVNALCKVEILPHMGRSPVDEVVRITPRGKR